MMGLKREVVMNMENKEKARTVLEKMAKAENWYETESNTWVFMVGRDCGYTVKLTNGEYQTSYGLGELGTFQNIPTKPSDSFLAAVTSCQLHYASVHVDLTPRTFTPLETWLFLGDMANWALDINHHWCCTLGEGERYEQYRIVLQGGGYTAMYSQADVKGLIVVISDPERGFLEAVGACQIHYQQKYNVRVDSRNDQRRVCISSE